MVLLGVFIMVFAGLLQDLSLPTYVVMKLTISIKLLLVHSSALNINNSGKWINLEVAMYPFTIF